MPPLGPLLEPCFLLWTAFMTGHYLSGVARFLRPETLAPMLPLWSRSGPPHLWVATRQTLVLGLACGLTLASGRGAGRPVAGWLRLIRPFPWLDAPLGLLIVGLGGLGLGLAGLWYPGILIPFGVAGAVLFTRQEWRLGRHRSGPRAPARLSDGLTALRGLFFGGGLVASLPVLVSAWALLLTLLAPETFQDPLRYHLFFPARFLLEHRFIGYERFFFWSYLGPVHMLYGIALAAGGPVAAKAVNLAFFILAFNSLMRIGSRVFEGPGERRLLAALALTAPGLLLITGSAFVEHAVSLYLLLAVEVLLLRPATFLRRSTIAAGLLGVAASMKYTAAFGAAGLVAMILVERSQPGSARRPARLPGPAGWLLLPFLPWAALRWWWTGDPVSPILARLPLGSLDRTSLPALRVAYGFARAAWRSWMATPSLLFSFPLSFAGGHEGFWEYPGPALACLMPLLALHRALAPGGGPLLAFGAGSFLAWLVLFGGASPHYVAGLYGIWLLCALVLLPGLPSVSGRLLRHVLVYVCFLQAALTLAAASLRFGPRDVALGVVDPESHLLEMLPPRRVHLTARRQLDSREPLHGTVYVYGDDQSFYLPGRVQLDYEVGSDPLIWRIAQASRDSGELGKRLRQRGWTHMLYTTFWPYLEGRAGRMTFRHDNRTLELMQEFWRDRAELVVVTEGRTGRRLGPSSYVWKLLPARRTTPPDWDRTRRIPFLPGAEGVTFASDLALEAGDVTAAQTGYARALAAYPRYGVLHDRMTRLALVLKDRAAARAHLKAAAAVGWVSARLTQEVAGARGH